MRGFLPGSHAGLASAVCGPGVWSSRCTTESVEESINTIPVRVHEKIPVTSDEPVLVGRTA